MSACKANITSAAVSITNYAGNKTGSPSRNWWDGCMWRTENVRITQNTINFNPAHIMDCSFILPGPIGAGGIFSEYGVRRGQADGSSRLTSFFRMTCGRITYITVLRPFSPGTKEMEKIRLAGQTGPGA